VTAVGIVGLGEAGGVFAYELRNAGRTVICLDTRAGHRTATHARNLGITHSGSPEQFGAAATLVVVTVPAAAALAVAHEVIPHLRATATYADCTAKTPETRDAVASLCRDAGRRFSDVSVMDTVTWSDREIEVLASGDGATAFAEAMLGTRFRTTVVDASRPISAEVKLVRSIFTKGLSALLLETFSVAQRSGALPIVERSISRFMAEDFARVISLLVGSAPRHARRRATETDDARLFAARAGRAPVTTAAAEILSEVARLRDADPTGATDEWREVVTWLVEEGFLSRSSAR